MSETSVAFFCRTPGTAFVPVGPEGAVRAAAEERPVSASVREITVAWENTGDTPLVCQLEIRAKTDFPYRRYVIPAVTYNGNAWGKGKEPKGLALDGKPWVFDHRRTAIPACTVSENGERFFAMFASNNNAASLNASCSMIPCEDGRMLHRILYPGMETPLTYRDRDRYADAREAFVTLVPGEPFRTMVYLMEGAPEKECYATALVEDAALDLLAGPFPPRYTPEELEALCCSFARTLLVERNGQTLICTGNHWNGEAYTHRVDFEFGWCGQNGLYARQMLRRGFETDDTDLVRTGTAILDFWADRAGKTGLPYTNYNGDLLPNRTADVCNLSYAVAELAGAYRYLAEKGVVKARWLKAAETTAGFLLDRFSEENGFGKAWNVETGECVDGGGTIGAFMIPALCELHAVTRNRRYLEGAQRACRFYRDRDLAKFYCTAGALDTCCIDKETSWPLLSGALALYETDGDAKWLDCAKMAGWYFCSWMFHHDTLPVPGSDFATCGFRTLGGTAVSTQHHHLDPWGAFAVPGMLKLWRYTGDGHWKRRADLLWANAIQNVAPAEGKVFHGHRRPAGAQNEGYFHCRWGGANAPGEINEWLVSWPQAFIWNTASFLRDQDQAAAG